MEKWTGIISGTNRGLVFLDLDINKENHISGSFNVYDADTISLSGKVRGELKDNKIIAKLADFSPKHDGSPKEGHIECVMSDDKKEMKGKWSTDINTQGDCILYRLSTSEKQPTPINPNLTLETKDTTLYFCTFDKKSVENLFTIMTNITNAMREGKDQVLPPIYSITYDKEERIRTYSLIDFLTKYNEADKIWYVGFEFKDAADLKNIFINIYYQANLGTSFRSNILAESTDKNVVTIIPEVVRGLVSKVKNKNRWCHHWLFEALIQLAAVVTMFALSFLISRKLALLFPSQLEAHRAYIFVISLIILSNLWTYFFRLVFNYIYKSFPVVEILNKPKNKLVPGLVIGIIGSIFTSAIIYCLTLLWKLLF